MVSKILFLLGMFPVTLMYCGFLKRFLICFFNKEMREAGATKAAKWDCIIVIASGTMLLLSALTAHTLGW